MKVIVIIVCFLLLVYWFWPSSPGPSESTMDSSSRQSSVQQSNEDGRSRANNAELESTTADTSKAPLSAEPEGQQNQQKQLRVSKTFAKVYGKKDFLAAYPGQWMFSYADSPRREIVGVGGDVINHPISNPNEIQDLAKSVVPMFDGEPDGVGKVTEGAQTARQESYDVKQVFEGLPVYQGSLSFSVRRRDSKVFNISSQWRPIERFDRTVNVNLDQALSLLESFLKKVQLTNVDIKKPDQPTVFVDRNGNAQLSWVFMATGKGHRPEVIEYVVGAITGDVLYQQVMHTTD